MSQENKDFFAELNSQIKKAGGIPDSFTVGGATYTRAGSEPQKTRKRWVNPRDPKDVIEDCEFEFITIDPAPFADRVVLNSVNYMAGHTYELPSFMCDQIRDIHAQSWKHERQTGGANSHGVGPVRNQRAGLNFVN